MRPTTSPSWTSKETSATPAPVRSCTDAARAVRCGRRRSTAGRRQAAADDHLHNSRDSSVSPYGRADDAPVAQHGDPVRDLAHLVEVVRDEEHRRAGRRSSRTSANSRSTPSRGRNTVGSSSTSIPASCRRARISSIARTIARSARSTGLSSPTIAVGVDPHAVARERLPRAPALPAPRDGQREREARAMSATRRFSTTVSSSTRPRSWCTKPMPSSRNSPGGSGRHRLAGDHELAVVRGVEAREDLDQRRLARAVLARAGRAPRRRARSRSTASRAWMPPKLLESPRADSAGSRRAAARGSAWASTTCQPPQLPVVAG